MGRLWLVSALAIVLALVAEASLPANQELREPLEKASPKNVGPSVSGDAETDTEEDAEPVGEEDGDSSSDSSSESSSGSSSDASVHEVQEKFNAWAKPARDETWTKKASNSLRKSKMKTKMTDEEIAENAKRLFAKLPDISRFMKDIYTGTMNLHEKISNAFNIGDDDTPAGAQAASIRDSYRFFARKDKKKSKDGGSPPTSPESEQEAGDGTCPAFGTPPSPHFDGIWYPQAKCVYPQNSDTDAFSRHNLDRLFTKVSNEVPKPLPAECHDINPNDPDHVSTTYRCIRASMIDGDELFELPRAYGSRGGQPPTKLQWDLVQNGRTTETEQSIRRLARYKHKQQFFQNRGEAMNFFAADSPKELCVNAYIKYVRNQDEWEHDGRPAKDRRVLRQHFPPAHNFFHPFIRKKIEQSRLYSIARAFPKGAILHSHFWSLSSAETMARMMTSPSPQEFIMGINSENESPSIPESRNEQEKRVYDAAYSSLMADMLDQNEENWAFPGVWEKVNGVLNSKLQSKVHICGPLSELIEGLQIENMFDADSSVNLDINDNTHSDCHIYEWKSGKAKAEVDDGSAPVGTMAFFPINPNESPCPLVDHNGECRALEMKMFNPTATTMQELIDAMDLTVNLKRDVDGNPIFAKLTGWRNLQDELQDPGNDQRMRNAMRTAKQKAIDLGIICPDGCAKISGHAEEKFPGVDDLDFFLEGDPFKIVLLSYFQMGYWDLHTMTESRDLWKKLEATWARTGNVAKFLPFFHMYVADTVKRALADNVQILEARHKPGALYNYLKDPHPNAPRGPDVGTQWNLEQKMTPTEELELIDMLVSTMNGVSQQMWGPNVGVPNQLKLKVIAFERRIGQLMGGTAQAQKLFDTLEKGALLEKPIAKPCPGGKLFVDKDGATFDAVKYSSKCGMLAGFDIAGEEDSFYFYGRGNNRDVARHFFAVQTALNKHLTNKHEGKFEEKWLTPHHSGETNNAESYNMIDSYVTQKAAGYGKPDESPEKQGRPMRFGHGIALAKFPHLMNELLGSEDNPPNVLIEVNPISNQVLGYVPDLRNHPGIHQMRRGLAIALSFDDPSQFGYSDVSFDWYQALNGWKLDLSDLKELALNSIAFSSLSVSEQAEAFQLWEERYKLFTNDYVVEALRELQDLTAKGAFDRMSHDLDDYMQPLQWNLRDKCAFISADDIVYDEDALGPEPGADGESSKKKEKGPDSPPKRVVSSLFAEPRFGIPSEQLNPRG